MIGYHFPHILIVQSLQESIRGATYLVLPNMCEACRIVGSEQRTHRPILCFSNISIQHIPLLAGEDDGVEGRSTVYYFSPTFPHPVSGLPSPILSLGKCPANRNVLRYLPILARWVIILDVTLGGVALRKAPQSPHSHTKSRA